MFSKPKKIITTTSTEWADLLKDLESFKPQAENILKIQMDKLVDFKIANISQLAQLNLANFCFSLERDIRGGFFKGTEFEWKGIVEICLKAGFGYVEVDFADTMLLDLGDKHSQTKLICTYKNLNQTPGYRNLRKIQKRMGGFKPEIKVFLTKVKSPEDTQTLLRLLLNKKKSEKIALFPVGPKADLVREISLKLGMELEKEG